MRDVYAEIVEAIKTNDVSALWEIASFDLDEYKYLVEQCALNGVSLNKDTRYQTMHTVLCDMQIGAFTLVFGMYAKNDDGTSYPINDKVHLFRARRLAHNVVDKMRSPNIQDLVNGLVIDPLPFDELTKA